MCRGFPKKNHTRLNGVGASENILNRHLKFFIVHELCEDNYIHRSFDITLKPNHDKIAYVIDNFEFVKKIAYYLKHFCGKKIVTWEMICSACFFLNSFIIDDEFLNSIIYVPIEHVPKLMYNVNLLITPKYEYIFEDEFNFLKLI